MAYEMVMPYHLHMPSYFLETFTEYPKKDWCFLYEKHQSYLIKKIPLSAFYFQFIQNSTHLFKCCDTSRYKRQT